ncbi:cytochrome ba3 quinol oxidase subunit 2 [Paracoccus pantotrophus]|uniref:Ubiquinol oxidase polypeptide II n=2 Tax=Paracoccus pantotrophus TaxID=82367 RepID=A0AAE6TTQ7_PARPN|nr:ubiquinol oxidase subunit II [Paracoccus pantotrophus]QFG36537.1 ubiquinol oxidase subunit II [Paracoccus pantotrophus]RKS42869.1 cytochrome ba3 quinol oxidase subunit 2 [Paracoccus pantotrophus]
MTYIRKFARLPWLALLIPLAACKAEVLAPAGDVAARQRDLLVISTLLMLLIIVPVMVLTVIFARRYRERNKDADYRPDWDHSTKLEFVIWAAPLLIIITLGALTWVGTHLLDPYRPLDRISADRPLTEAHEPLPVQVVAMDWKWLFIYPEQGIASVNELAVPVDRPVAFTLTSTSVMNAFYIPAMAGMIYAMPGMETKLNGVFNHPGEYKGIASHYSGHGFSGMHFKAHATDEAGFDAWVEKARATGGTLDRPRYLELEAPSENVPPMSFAEVDPQLFQRIVNMCVEPGKICMAEMMALDAQGGTGLAGTMNVTALTYDKHQRRGTRAPVLGWEPFQVASFCTPEDSALMFGQSPELARTPLDTAPLRGHALVPPKGPFAPSQDNAVTLLDPAEGRARNF